MREGIVRQLLVFRAAAVRQPCRVQLQRLMQHSCTQNLVVKFKQYLVPIPLRRGMGRSLRGFLYTMTSGVGTGQAVALHSNLWHVILVRQPCCRYRRGFRQAIAMGFRAGALRAGRGGVPCEVCFRQQHLWLEAKSLSGILGFRAAAVRAGRGGCAPARLVSGSCVVAGARRQL